MPLGILELRGITASIEAADAMVKAAAVKVIATQKIGNALIFIVITGTVAAVSESLRAGRAMAECLGELYACTIIPNPEPELYQIIEVIAK